MKLRKLSAATACLLAASTIAPLPSIATEVFLDGVCKKVSLFEGSYKGNADAIRDSRWRDDEDLASKLSFLADEGGVWPGETIFAYERQSNGMVLGRYNGRNFTQMDTDTTYNSGYYAGKIPCMHMMTIGLFAALKGLISAMEVVI